MLAGGIPTRVAVGPAATRRRPIPTWTRATAPALVYLAGQVLTLTVVSLIGAVHGRTLRALLTGWDGQLLLQIAAVGYAPAVRNGRMVGPGGSIAFFPGYPGVVHWAGVELGTPLEAAAFVVSGVAGIVAAYGLVRLVRQLRGGDRAAGLCCVALYSTGPLSVVLAMTYSESLFCAVAVWGLVAAVEGRWPWAGAAAAAAGLLRPTGLALVVAVVVCALLAALRTRDRRGRRAALAGAVVAPVGLAAYLAWISLRYGSVGTYFQVQKVGWNSHFDAGRATGRFLLATLTSGREVVDLAVVAVLLGSLAALVLLVRQQRRLDLALYAAVVVAMDLGSDGILNSKVRLMVPAVTLLVPVAIWLRRQPGLLRIFGLTGVALVGTWYSAYCLVLYPHAI